MAAIKPVVLKDAASTQKSHTFTPAESSGNRAMWLDRSSSAFVGFNKLTMEMKRPTGAQAGNRNIRTNIRLELPVLNTLSANSAGVVPAPSVAYRVVCDIGLTFPERSVLQDRKDLLQMVKDLIATDEVKLIFENYELSY